MAAPVNGIVTRFALVDGCEGILWILGWYESREPCRGTLPIHGAPLGCPGLTGDMVPLDLSLMGRSLTIFRHGYEGLTQGGHVLGFDL